ncbi:MAG: DUF1028 domain-containing protein [Thaumarchaeota archaeon]|nr:DUF1028 domain-containing protein [Nitrososphaerota archaeon]
MASRPISTYSIVAIDKKSGEMGVAVQSHWFSVGSVVTWAEGGVGVVATQAMVEVSYGPLGLALMKGGKSPQQALKSLIATDPRPEIRQVAMLDARGRVSAHTGKKCLAEAGHITGRGFSCQANIMRNRKVWRAMANSFRKSKGSLAERLMLALESAEQAGGDLRGRQSAAILVVKVKGSSMPWQDRVVDLRVEDNPLPLVELRRLLKIEQAYVHANNGDLMTEKGDMKRALDEYKRSAQLYPENVELKFWQAVSLINHGEVKEGRAILKRILRSHPDMRTMLKRMPAAGLLKVDPKTMHELLRL